MPAKRKKYKFTPKVHAIAASHQLITNLVVQKAVVKDVLKGLSYEAIAEKRHITPEEARNYSKVAIARWSGELAHTATEAKEIDIKRMDALLERLHPLVFPDPYIDNDTKNTVIPAPDIPASKLYLDILQQRSKLLGTEAAHKLEEQKHEILQRMYIGVSVNKQGAIDL
jgi:hypothetical protein